MFRHVLAFASEHPSLAAGQPWSGFLSAREQEIFAGFTFPRRRRKWLLGRVAAKRLVREMWHGPELPDEGITILNRPSGEPFVIVEGQGEWEYPISISHRSEVGMAAAPLERGARIGADVEIVEPRELALVGQFFTEREAESVAAAGANRDEILTRIWSAKEAVLKLLGIGLRADTRGIEVSLVGDPFPECLAGWQPISVQVSGASPTLAALKELRVVWRREGGHVLTVAVDVAG